MRLLGAAILLGSSRRFARSPTVLQAQTLVFLAGVDVVTVNASVAADEGNYAAVSAAAAQVTGADAGDSNCHAAAAAVQLPRGPTAAAVHFPRGSAAAAVQPSDDRC